MLTRSRPLARLLRNASGFPVDTPGDELPNGSEYIQVQGSDTFEMWIMFQPTNSMSGIPVVNSVPVPLRAVNWSWGGAATNFWADGFLRMVPIAPIHLISQLQHSLNGIAM